MLGNELKNQNKAFAPLTHISPCTFRTGNLCFTRFYYACEILYFVGHVNQAPCVDLSCNYTQDTLGTVL